MVTNTEWGMSWELMMILVAIGMSMIIMSMIVFLRGNKSEKN